MLELEADPRIGSMWSCVINISDTTTACKTRQHLKVALFNPIKSCHATRPKCGMPRRDSSFAKTSLTLGTSFRLVTMAVYPFPLSTLPFTLVDTNSVHTTRLAFCGCVALDTKTEQLMHALPPPATTRDPRTAFILRVLNEFHLHNLGSGGTAYDYLEAIRRLAGNSFAADVPVCHEMFLSVPFSDTLLQ